MSSLSNISAYGSLTSAGLTEAAFTYSAGGKAVCITGMLEVPVVATTVNVTYGGPANNYELTEFITDFLRVGSTAFEKNLGGSTQVSDTFKVYSKLCVPAGQVTSDHPKFVQFLTHGGITENSYWDFAPGYSYIDAAAERNFVTFSYDRLGIGKSDHPDPLQVVQVPLQAELAHAIIEKLKAGSIGDISFESVQGVGHSLGSALTQSVSAKYPDDFDAVILTGHSGFRNGAGTGFAAAAQQIANTLPDRMEFENLPNGYFSIGPVTQALQFAFFYHPYFDPLLFIKEFETRQTNAIGETMTLGGIYAPATEFKKPVLILNGQQDFFYCQGNCLANEGDLTVDALAMYYPNRALQSSRAVTLPNMGHNINLHLGRLEAFRVMLDFASDL